MRLLNRYLRPGASTPNGATPAAGYPSHASGWQLPETPDNAIRYLAVVAATIVLVTAGFVGILWGLELAGRRPPPAFTNSYCFDAKLEFLRQNPPVRPTHLVVGSSIAWRNIAAAVFAEQHPNARPLNGAFCGLSVNQSAYTARFLLRRFPTVTDVLLVVDPFDMSACRSNKTAIFDAADVSDYLSGADDLGFYFKYFDFFSLMANAFGDKQVFTRHGDGPLDTDESYGLVYGPPPHMQPECQDALAEFAEELEEDGKRLVVMTMPLLSSWSDKYDRDSQAREKLANGIRQALQGKSATFWDGWSDIVIPPADYTDAVHLRWSAVPRFTRRLARATGFGERGI